MISSFFYVDDKSFETAGKKNMAVFISEDSENVQKQYLLVLFNKGENSFPVFCIDLGPAF